MALDIARIIECEGVETLMQLVISPNRDYAAGIEALSRGVDPETGETIMPQELFTAAEAQGLSVELEKLMVRKALETFKPIYEAKPMTLLFVNVTETFISACEDEQFILKLTEALDIPPKNIFFDLIGVKDSHLDGIYRFIQRMRPHGFYFCLDDVGSTYANIDRILYLNPDMVKINIRSMRNLPHQDYVKAMIEWLKKMVEQMGVIHVAKGIEDATDVAYAIENGAQFMQGYYISKPLDLDQESLVDIMEHYRRLMETQIKAEEQTLESNRILTGKVINLSKQVRAYLEDIEFIERDEAASSFFSAFPMIENLWLLNDKGIQVGTGWRNKEHFDMRHGSLFNLYTPGSDFSGKDLFQQLDNAFIEVWVTPPFRSIMTNNICLSCSVKMKDKSDNSERVLCINVNMDAAAMEASKPVPVTDNSLDDCRIVITSQA